MFETAILFLLIAIISGSIFLGFERTKCREEIDLQASQITAVLNQARLRAIIARRRIFVLPFQRKDSEEPEITKYFNDGILVSRHYFSPGQYIPAADILEEKRLLKDSQLTWNGFGSQKAISFDAHGFLNYSNGHFLLQKKCRESLLSVKIIINRIGRIAKEEISSD